MTSHPHIPIIPFILKHRSIELELSYHLHSKAVVDFLLFFINLKFLKQFKTFIAFMWRYEYIEKVESVCLFFT